MAVTDSSEARSIDEVETEVPRYRWSRDEFVRAWELGAFARRAELIEGEVWEIVIGLWHAELTPKLVLSLPPGGTPLMGTLPSGGSLPDPDIWVRRAGATPTGAIGHRLHSWDPDDVLLVIEVSDESIAQDLGVKARLYAEAGYAVYWVVTPDAIYEHTDPTTEGYKTRRAYRPGERIPVSYAGTDLDVAALLAPSA